ncbi:hypothetical protein [Thermostichus vulcanus]|uniref:Uncharacterized protein n=1 Tax=Thermostichus vulcanus str. 'Rupite' TaxID=2813851 RepID=A0ABT0CDS3_THEVL|nr:hypothetical protein [Thermostichus vulcanus]MCJ2543933.1 hypothetical protein [Thermostichus vulcanus str. 'Rupite']
MLSAQRIFGAAALLSLCIGIGSAAQAQTVIPQQKVILNSNATTVNSGSGNATTIQNNLLIVPNAPAPRRSGSWGLSGRGSSRPTPPPTSITVIFVNQVINGPVETQPTPDPCQQGRCSSYILP